MPLPPPSGCRSGSIVIRHRIDDPMPHHVATSVRLMVVTSAGIVTVWLLKNDSMVRMGICVTQQRLCVCVCVHTYVYMLILSRKCDFMFIICFINYFTVAVIKYNLWKSLFDLEFPRWGGDRVHHGRESGSKWQA